MTAQAISLDISPETQRIRLHGTGTRATPREVHDTVGLPRRDLQSAKAQATFSHGEAFKMGLPISKKSACKCRE